MGGNEERKVAPGHGLGHGAMRPRPPDRTSNIAVRDRLSELELRDEPPGRKLQRRPVQRERDLETAQAPAKIRPHLLGSIGQEWIANSHARARAGFERRRNEPRVIPFDCKQKPERRGEKDFS